MGQAMTDATNNPWVRAGESLLDEFETRFGLHSNRMVIEEKATARGAAMHCAHAEAFLNDGFAV
jgi:hypothetical protein